MYFDLTKPDEPEEPAAATVPLPGPVATDPAAATVPLPPPAATVEKEPVRLTAREKRMLPVKAFAAAVAAGSPVLTGLILSALWRGVQAASRTQDAAAPQPAPTAKAAQPVKASKDDEPAEGTGEGGKEDEKAAPAGKAGDLGDTAERLAMGALVIGVVCVMATGVFAFVWSFLAPYAGWIVLGLIVGWCLAAVHVAPELNDDEDQEDEATPVNDHENVAGEQPTADTAEEAGELEEDPWHAQRELLRTFVEHRATTIAGGHHALAKGKGVPVDYLLDEQQRHGGLIGFDRKDMIDLLGRAGITVRTQMKFRVMERAEADGRWKEKNLPGVHVDDLRLNLGRMPRLPPDLVADFTPAPARELGSIPGQEPAPIRTARTAAE